MSMHHASSGACRVWALFLLAGCQPVADVGVGLVAQVRTEQGPLGNVADRMFGTGFGRVEALRSESGSTMPVRWLDEGAVAWLRQHGHGGRVRIEGDCDMRVLDTKPRVTLLLRGAFVAAQRVENGHFLFDVELPSAGETARWLPLELRISSIGQHEYSIPRLRAWRVSAVDWTPH